MCKKSRIVSKYKGKSFWKTLLLIAVLPAFCIFPGVSPVPEKNRPDTEIIRFHVLAHSDNQYDQEIKNFLAGRLIDTFGPLWNRCQSSEELSALLKKDKGLIGETACAILEENGFSGPVKVEFGKSRFPARFYGDRFYPSGEYTSLTVKIGAGKGENWWCVLFPPLCFTVFPSPAGKEDIKEDNHSDVVNTQVDKASDQGSPLENVTEAAPPEKEKSKWRFWIVDFLAGIFH